jgi:hypothetical protein
MIMGSQVVEHKPDEVAELLALLRHFTPDEEEVFLHIKTLKLDT